MAESRRVAMPWSQVYLRQERIPAPDAATSYDDDAAYVPVPIATPKSVWGRGCAAPAVTDAGRERGW